MKLKSISIAILFVSCLAIGKEKKIDIQANLLDACKAKIEAKLRKQGERGSIINSEQSPDSLIYTALRLSRVSIETDKERLKNYKKSLKGDKALIYLNGEYAYLTMVGSSRLVSIHGCNWRGDYAGIESIYDGGFLVPN